MKTTREKVRELTARELSPREIATLTGVSTQRVYQILREEQEETGE